MEFQGKRILIMGFARSGKAALQLLLKLGAEDIVITDLRPVPEDCLSDTVKYHPQTEELFDEDFDLVIKNPGVPHVSPLVRKLRERNIPVITEIELAYQTAKPQHYVAITGTNGKTTTTTLVYEFLKQHYGDKALVGGNIGIPLCELVLEHDLLEQEGYYIALEISQAQLVDIEQFRPEVAAIMNLTPDHVDVMGSLETYYWSKTLVYKNMKEEDTFILNADDENLKVYTKKYPVHCKIKSISLERTDTDGYLKDGWMIIDGQKILETGRIQIPGRHNLQNMIVAVSACMAAGVTAEEIRRAAYAFQGVEHRIEFVRELDGVKYYNDSKGTNTDATITALKAFDHGVILLVGGFEKNLSMDEMKNYLGCVKQVIGYGKSGPRIAGDLVGEKAIITEDLVQAVHEARKIATAGDTVLLSPTTSSFDQYSGFEERGRHFKAIVQGLE
ncbi:MAG: UDP-N-acetylmuramoyl-L-alanine--D-glutamate ligase [Solobacterium sp.]|nr:UDP-N-acetylmuramoyl-L-alanine--D-glutamate ligase [Solobacterium sp.]